MQCSRPLATLAVLLLAAAAPSPAGEAKPPLATPTPEQLAWQDLEFGLVVHFGINTFHDIESSDGTLEPKTFRPFDFSAKQWVEVARRIGMRYLVLTAKHHDGFCLFQSRHTRYGVMSSPWREGKGDVVAEASEACREHGLPFGLYFSLWDRHCPFYSDASRYDAYVAKQLTELLTRYGPVALVWLDPAGPEGRRYDLRAYRDLIKKLQPKTLVVIDRAPDLSDIRWEGEAKGIVPDPCWSFVEQDGAPAWRPPACRVPLRDAWFWRSDNEGSMKSLDQLIDIYHRSIGHGASLLLNVGADRRGQLPEVDFERLKLFGDVVAEMMRADFARGRRAVSLDFAPGGEARRAVDGKLETAWQTPAETTETRFELDLGQDQRFNRAVLMEPIARGQRIRRYVLEYRDAQGKWAKLAEGAAVGHKKTDVFEPVIARRLRLRITEAAAPPGLRTLGLHYTSHYYRKTP